jgi:hypothetical protein
VAATCLDNVLSVVVDGEDVVGEEVILCLLPPVLHLSLLLTDESPHGKVICREGRLRVIQRLEATCLGMSLFCESGIDIPLSVAQPCSRRDMCFWRVGKRGLAMCGEKACYFTGHGHSSPGSTPFFTAEDTRRVDAHAGSMRGSTALERASLGGHTVDELKVEVAIDGILKGLYIGRVQSVGAQLPSGKVDWGFSSHPPRHRAGLHPLKFRAWTRACACIHDGRRAFPSARRVLRGTRGEEGQSFGWEASLLRNGSW